MPRKKPANNPEGFTKQSIWNLTEDSSPENVRDWDVKTAQFSEAVLSILATGAAVMFGTTMSGGAISITIFDDGDKVRQYATDSIELDDWADSVIGKARKHLDGLKQAQARGVPAEKPA